MRSESWLDRTWLRSQGLGVICGLSTVVLLGVGSFVLVATADGASAGVAMDDLRIFFERPALAHLWLYLLLPVFGLYGLNTALATIHSVSRKLAAGAHAISAYGPPVIHVSFLLALLAHLVGGVASREIKPIRIAGSWTALGDGREVRVIRLESEMLPSGMPKRVRAHVEVRRGDRVEPAVIGYNEPLSEGFGANIFLLAEAGQISAAKLRLGEETCVVAEKSACTLAGRRVELVALAEIERGKMPMAAVRVSPVDGGAIEMRRLVPGLRVSLASGGALILEGFEDQPAVIVRGRRAPGTPWALGSAILLALGVVMMARRIVPRDRDAEG